MKAATHPRRILHLDLDPFFVAVERSLNPALRGLPVVVGGQSAGDGIVAAASTEARAAGVRPSQTIAMARRLCPDGAFRPGDLAAYAQASEEVTGILLGASGRVERPSADEAYVDLSLGVISAAGAASAAEAIKDQLQRRLGLDVALGLASSRLAARVASSWARPRGLLIVLPGYEASFLARQPVSFLPELPEHIREALERAGIDSLGTLIAAEEDTLVAAVGVVAARRLREAARGEGEAPIALTAPPTWVREDVAVHDRGADRASLEAMLDGLTTRLWRRLLPFSLQPGHVAVEIRRRRGQDQRSETIQPALQDERAAHVVARSLAAPLLDPPQGVVGLEVRFSRLSKPTSQSRLFPDVPGVAR